MGLMFNAFLVTLELVADAAGVAGRLHEAYLEHGPRRLRKVVAVATFPLVTPRADDPKLWRACGRVALRGLVSPHPRALDYFVAMREHVEASKSAARALQAFAESASRRADVLRRPRGMGGPGRVVTG